MKQTKLLAQCMLFVVEIALLVAWVLTLLWPDEPHVEHGSTLPVTIICALGFSLLATSFIYRFLKARSDVRFGARLFFVLYFVCGIGLLIIGGIKAVYIFPELTRPSCVQSVDERWESIGAVSVRFDANGGSCEDCNRVVKHKETYGASLNVYPSDDERMMRLHLAKIDLRNGWIHVDTKNETLERWFVDYFTSNSIPDRVQEGCWTYVVDVAEMTGAFASWRVGLTGGANSNVLAQLSQSQVRQSIKGGEKEFLVLRGARPTDKCTFLDRAYILLNSGQKLNARFRISLFAGRGVTSSNYRYVNPGDVVACKLPLPTWKGHEFLGWYDADGQRIVESTKVMRRSDHTLKAHWRKNEG